MIEFLNTLDPVDLSFLILFLLFALIGVVIVSLKQVNVAFDSGYDSGKYAGEQGLIAVEAIGYKKGFADGKRAHESRPNPTKTPVKQPSKPSNNGRRARSGQIKRKPPAKQPARGAKAK